MKNDTTCLRITVDKDKIDYKKQQLFLKQDIFSKREGLMINYYISSEYKENLASYLN